MRKALATLGVLLAFWFKADAATFTVSNTADSGAGSLRQAILDSEASPGSDEINFSIVTGTITLESILPTVTDSVTVAGPGSAALTVSGNNHSQLLAIDQGAVVLVSGVTFAGGRTDNTGGGAILNSGNLTVVNCRFTSNSAVGAFGGAIYNNAELTISQSEFSNNRCFGTSVVLGPSAVPDAKGGAIFSAAGSITLNDCIFTQNSAAGVAGLTADSPTAGGSAFGGALFIEAGTGNLTRIQISQSAVTGGLGGSATGLITGTLRGARGGEARGGALFLSAGSVTLSQSTLQDNTCTSGSGGSGHSGGGAGGESSGGGIMNLAGQFIVTATTVFSNRVQGGKGGSAGSGNQPGPGGAALGGAIACSGGTTQTTNTTISSNVVIGGNGANGSGPGGSAPGVAGGGAAYHGGGNLSVLNCTLALNEARPGVTLPFGGVGSTTVGQRFGGGIYAPTSSPEVQNSLFSGNLLRVVVQGNPTTTTPSDGYGTFASLGHNLLETDASVSGLVSTDLVIIAALIQSLANNGGPTLTHALGAGSPALDAGDNLGAPALDQRGETRPQGAAVDIGAFERSALAILIDDTLVLSAPVTKDVSTVLKFESPYPTGAILYTLDGSTPTLSSTPYTQPVTLTQSATIWAIAYNTDFSSFVSAGPIELTIIPGRTLTITTFGQGTVNANPPSEPYVNGTVVTLTAQSAAGWRFQGWTGDLSGSTSPTTITMDANKTVQAFFVQIPTYTLAVLSSGQGAVEISPATGPYIENSTVTLTAHPTQGWGFAGWSGDASGAENPLTVTMNANKSVQATFRRIVSFNATTAGGGSINLVPSSGPYLQGETVTATAQPAAGWQFLYWRGDLESTTDPTIEMVLTENTSIEAVFGTTVTFNAVGGGTILAQPTASIFPYGSSVRLTGIPAEGKRFSFWGSPIDSQSNPVEATITQPNPSFSGVFVPLEANEVALTVITEGGGRVSTSPAGNHFTTGTSVELTAVSPPGYRFTGWSGDESGADNPLQVVMTMSKVITANFIASPYTSVAFASSSAVPGEPAGTIFDTFRIPAINEAGQFAFTANTLDHGIRTTVVFATNRVVARKDSLAPDESGNPHPFYFSEFLDPVLDEQGQIAFIATVTDLNGKNPRSGVWTDADGTLKLVALQTGQVPGVEGQWKSFSSVSLQDSQLIILGTIKQGNGVKAANDRGAWSWTPNEGMKLLLREGITQVTTPTGPKTIKSIAILPSVSGSLAQGRSHAARKAGSPALTARVTFTDKTEAILQDDGTGDFRLEALAATVMPVNTYTGDPALADLQWDTFGFPGWSLDGKRLGFLASMRSNGSKPAGDQGIFVDSLDSRLDLRVRKGDEAPDPSASPLAGATFQSFKDPVIGDSPVEYAFVGKLAGNKTSAANDQGIWMGTSEGLKLVAREGDGAEALPNDARWKAFQSLALGSSRGPLFVADLKPGVGGVTPATKRGLWGMDSSGRLWPLLRQGDSVDLGEVSSQVSRFTALAPAVGAEGTSRGFSASGAQVATLVSFKNGVQAILTISVP